MYITCLNCGEIQPKQEPKVYNLNTILVEGGDDEQFISGLIKKRNINIKELTIDICGGYPKIIKSIENLSRHEGYGSMRRLIVIADANSVGVKNRFESIIKSIDKNEFTIPNSIGVLSNKEHDKRQFGVFLFPDNVNNGAIEDLCMNALINKDNLKAVDSFIKSLIEKGILEEGDHNISKRKIHIYMAMSKNPTGNIGGAVKQGEINFESNEFDLLEKFLKSIG